MIESYQKRRPPSRKDIVELLIVVVVLGILASIALVSYASILPRARDSQRKSDVAAIAKALEQHYVKYNSYTQPEAMCTDTSVGAEGGCGGSGTTGDWDANSDLRDLVTDGYLSALPLDPINDSTYKYSYEPSSIAANGFDSFSFCARLETTGANHCASIRK